MKQKSLLFLLGWLGLLGCVGTDVLNDENVGVPARIVINPTSAAVQVANTIEFQAAYYDTLGNSVPGTVFQWSSSNPGIAAIDNNGIARGQGIGQVMITATALGVASEPALLTVVANPNQLARVVVTPDSGGIRVGETLQFSATAFNLNGDELSGQTFTWRSSNPNSATVDANGLAAGVGSGMAQIVAETDGVASAPARLTVRNTRRTGTFTRNPNTSYNVQGTATLEERTDGSLVLSLGNDFSSSNGPGLEVFLSNINGVNSQSRSLGRLQRTSGAQSYNVPAGIQLTTYDWVVIHCVPFNVTFGYARLQ